MQENIASSVSQVPRDFSDQEKMSWLFVLINIKAVTAFPLSFLLCIAFCTTGGSLQHLRFTTVQIINSNKYNKTIYMHMEHYKTRTLNSAGQT